LKSIVIEIPFDSNILKNKTFGVVRGRIYVHNHSKKIKKVIEDVCRRACVEKNVAFAKQKIWLKVMVEKPDMRSYAINVIDVLCDGIKKGIGVDDRWFAIKELDFKINKENPRILFEVSQE